MSVDVAKIEIETREEMRDLWHLLWLIADQHGGRVTVRIDKNFNPNDCSLAIDKRLDGTVHVIAARRGA